MADDALGAGGLLPGLGLQRGVVHVPAPGEALSEGGLDRGGAGPVVEDDMRVEARPVLLHAPEMDVVQPGHPLQPLEVVDHRARIQSLRRAQHQDAGGVAPSRPRHAENHRRDDQRRQRIGEAPVVEQDQRAGDDHGDRGQSVAEIVQEGGADVDAAPGAGGGEQSRDDVDREREAGEGDDGPALHRRRVPGASGGLHDQPEAERREGGAVHERGDGLDPAVAEGHARVRRAARHAPGEERGAERDGVRQIVQGVRGEGERAGEERAEELRRGQAEIDRDGGGEAAAVDLGRGVVVGHGRLPR